MGLRKCNLNSEERSRSSPTLVAFAVGGFLCPPRRQGLTLGVFRCPWMDQPLLPEPLCEGQPPPCTSQAALARPEDRAGTWVLV